MLTFAQFLHHAAGKEEAVNLMFEERLFGLVETLHRVADMFAAEHIPYELVGGMAVAAQLEQVDRDAVMLTRGVDVMIHRSDLERVKDRVAKGVHLVFSGEYMKAHQAPNPAIDPQRITIYGKEVPVVPVVDLVA